MSLAIKTLEEIGQNTSIKQHDNVEVMLKDLEIEESLIENIGLKTQDFVCALFPQDDKDDKDTQDDDKDNQDDDNDTQDTND